ncbi:hypothetical protein [Caulobacter sp. NIBR1757]|uniref:hypothetical protein n=1 Tax=Caulobacter sp. NIBR1757 TaxID=3016000 RepID=UPI0022EFD88C|nr:hypothetical protein [Caulobacter sp. NIBR1757]WGM38570.1 hypothetical protein AMEJIAPC_01473 [Caulobacter sp. NIBR1757]
MASRTLEGRLDAPDLSAQEQDHRFKQLGDRFAAPTEAVRARYAALGAMPGAAGEVDGEVVERRRDGGLEPRR